MKTKMFVRDGMDGGFAGENAKFEILLHRRFVKRPYGFCFGALCSQGGHLWAAGFLCRAAAGHRSTPCGFRLGSVRIGGRISASARVRFGFSEKWG